MNRQQKKDKLKTYQKGPKLDRKGANRKFDQQNIQKFDKNATKICMENGPKVPKVSQKATKNEPKLLDKFTHSNFEYKISTAEANWSPKTYY